MISIKQIATAGGQDCSMLMMNNAIKQHIKIIIPTPGQQIFANDVMSTLPVAMALVSACLPPPTQSRNAT